MSELRIYLIGSLANRGIVALANRLRDEGWDVFDDWISPGEEADEKWREYEQLRGRGYKEALNGRHAHHIFEFDFKHLQEADVVVMVLPCGRSGHLELGWAIGQGKPAYILFDGEPERYDLMYALVDDVFFSEQSLFDALRTKRLSSF